MGTWGQQGTKKGQVVVQGRWKQGVGGSEELACQGGALEHARLCKGVWGGEGGKGGHQAVHAACHFSRACH